MVVVRGQAPAALMHRCRDPDVVRRDRRALPLKMVHEVPADLRRSESHGMDLDPGLREELPHFARVFFKLRPFAKSMMQFADDRCRNHDPVGDRDQQKCIQST